MLLLDMSEEELIKRFNDMNMLIVHLQTQFDQLLQSFNIYSNLQAEVQEHTRKVEELRNTFSSSLVQFNDISTELTKLDQKVTSLDSSVNNFKPQEQWDYTAPPSVDCPD